MNITYKVKEFPKNSFVNNHIDVISEKCAQVRNKSISNGMVLNLLKSELDNFEWQIYLQIRKNENSVNELSENIIKDLTDKIWNILKEFKKSEHDSLYNHVIMLMWDFVKNKIFSQFLDKIQVQRYNIIGCSISLKMMVEQNQKV